jgi:hypothetical protein
MLRVQGKGSSRRQVDTFPEPDRLFELIELKAEDEHVRMRIQLGLLRWCRCNHQY